MKVRINIDYDWVSGYLKYGSKEGIVNIPDEEIEEFKKNPRKYIKDHRIEDEIHFVDVTYSIEDYGDDFEISYEEIHE